MDGKCRCGQVKIGISAPPLLTMACEKLSWVVTPARHSYPELPPMEAFGALIADYARTDPGAAS